VDERHPTDQERLMDSLAQDARVQVEAWMLPTNRTLTPEEISAVRDKVREYIAKHDLKISKVAKSIGYGTATVSQFLSGKYNGTNETIARELNTFVDQHGAGRDPGMPAGFISTKIAERIIGVMKHAQRTRTVALIYGPAGVSKSLCAKAATQGLIAGSMHVECMKTAGNPGGFLRQFARMLGIGVSTRVSEIQFQIIERLRDTDRLVIIDEAHYLNADALHVVRDIQKQAGIGVALMGTRDIDQKMDDFSQFYGQMERLVSVRYDILEESQQSGEPLFTVDEVIALAQSARLRLTSDAATWLQMRANIPGWGGLGKAATLLATARVLAKKRNTDTIDVRDLAAAYRANEGLTHYERAEHKIADAARKKVAVA
jgi:DNA transposition AAA+ family ATPase